MATNKQARAAERKRYEEYQRKMEERRTARSRTQRITALIVVSVLVVAIAGVAVASSFSNPDQAAPATRPEATESATVGDTATNGPTEVLSFDAAPEPSYAEGREWTGTIVTNLGELSIRIDGDTAPQAASSFIFLAENGYFDGTECHRLTTNSIYVLQCGDPTATGTGGPGYFFGPIEAAPTDDIYLAGTIAMARRGGDGFSNGSQFFIVYADSQIPSDAAGGYSVFGAVTEGIAIVEGIAQAGTDTGASDGRPIEPVILNEVTVS